MVQTWDCPSTIQGVHRYAYGYASPRAPSVANLLPRTCISAALLLVNVLVSWLVSFFAGIWIEVPACAVIVI